MKCPYCGQVHPDEHIDCPSTGKKLKRACTNEKCSYYGEYLFPLNQEVCPCCGNSLNSDNGHMFIDLGLSVKWATCNIGARSPEEFGDYFAWGETAPINSNPRSRRSDELYYKRHTVLGQNDDAAHKNWGGTWRMPSKNEFEELIDGHNCLCEYTQFNGTRGYKIISKRPGFEGNSIFLPSTSNYENYIGTYNLCYWSSYFDLPYSPWCLMNDYYSIFVSEMIADEGHSIRAVCK